MSPGPAPRPERGARVVAGAGPDEHAVGGAPARLARAQHARQHQVGTAEGQFEEIGPVGVVGGGEVAGAGGVAAVGDEVVEGAGAAQLPREPVVREAHGGRARGVLRLVGREPAQLRGGDRRDRQRARRVRPLLRAQLGPPGRWPPAPSGCRSTAARAARPRRRRPGTPCRAAGPPPRSRRRPRGRPPAASAACNASHQPAGSTSVPGRMRRAAGPDVFAGGRVADDDGAGLRGRVDPGYQAHERHASASARRVGVRIGGSSRPQARRRAVLVPGVLGSGGNAACGRLGRRVAWRTFRAEALVPRYRGGRASGDLERQLRPLPAAAAAAVARPAGARRRLPPGDQAVRRGVRGELRRAAGRARVRLRARRRGPVERGGDPLAGRARRRAARAARGARLLRHRRGPRGDGDLRRPAGHVRLRAERAHARRPALRRTSWSGWRRCGSRSPRPRRAWSRAT